MNRTVEQQKSLEEMGKWKIREIVHNAGRNAFNRKALGLIHRCEAGMSIIEVYRLAQEEAAEARERKMRELGFTPEELM